MMNISLYFWCNGYDINDHSGTKIKKKKEKAKIITIKMRVILIVMTTSRR